MTHPAAKRLFDLGTAGLGLIAIAPALAVMALGVKLSDGGPVFYRQERVGRGGKPFRIWKFRTMVPNADRLGLSITRGGDSRITRIGRVLRRFKLDELPQLWNVLVGEMSFVGPRPEVARYVALYSPEQRQVLELKPGITDPASLAFRDEESMLAAASDPERFYIDTCMPRKIEINLAYARRATFWTDLWVILQTVIPPLHR